MICTWIHMLDNMEPIVRKEDVVAHDYVATAGNYFIGISTHASQLSHHSPPDSSLVTINASRTSHPGANYASNITTITPSGIREAATASKQQSHGCRIIGTCQPFV